MRLPPKNPFSNWYDKMCRYAISFGQIDPGRLGSFFTDLATTTAAASVTGAVSGTGANNALANLGGRNQATTGATANSTARLVNGQLTVQPNTEKFVVAARVRTVTVTDANSDNRVAGVNNTLASEFAALRLQNNVLAIVLMKGGVSTVQNTSWTPEQANYHDFIIASNLSSVFAIVDGISVGFTTTLTNLSNTPNNIELNAQNGATAANQEIIIDKMALFFQSP